MKIQEERITIKEKADALLKANNAAKNTMAKKAKEEAEWEQYEALKLKFEGK